MGGHLWVYFEIPYTPQQRDFLVMEEAKHLCFEFGECQSAQVRIMLNTITPFLGGAGSAASTIFSIIDNIAHPDKEGIGTDLAVEMLDKQVNGSGLAASLLIDMDAYVTGIEWYKPDATLAVNAKIRNQMEWLSYFWEHGNR